ncbi:b-cell differentiation antigen cd72 [Limosa lapponica baueri]|uniref:B-cell differentiation antigen cd72 n=1 Tax=Limosa lapponica baueri TaxID=1758121 RepID=A0A2I0TXY8_LIMLA|nr:b-cell differentiation antigen cd72 [Limosa lapponica baueri]
MAQSVVYADLRFAKVMGGRSMASQALEAALGMDEAESPYENTQPAPAAQDGDGAQSSPGRWSRRCCILVGLLATCLLLLVATIALGACCWLLYRGKCLFISSEKKTWEDSRDECEKKYSQLLVTKSWSRWTVPTFLRNADIPYWIGLQKSSFPWYDYGWLEEGDPGDDGVSDAWFWVDGSLYERPWQSKLNGSCAIISRGNIKPAQCEGPNDLHLWICEKAAGPSSPFIS